MNNNNNDVKQLGAHLEQEIDWLQQLNVLLTEEKAVLTARQFDKLEDLANKKQELSNKLEDSAQQRLHLIQNPNDNSENNLSLEVFLKTSNNHEVDSIRKLNDKLAEALTTCHELNAVNGQVIANNLYVRQEIVNVLSGKTTDAVSVYNANGNIKSATNNNHHRQA